MAVKYRTWGKWGPDDQLGHVNYIDSAKVSSAAKLVKRGTVFSLAVPLDRRGPQSGETWRVNPQHVMFRHGGDILTAPTEAQCGVQATDDGIYMPLQAGTQWDAFSHIFYDRTTYNGRGPDTVTGTGAKMNSIATMRDRLMTRGVLLDIPRWTGRTHLEPGEAIEASDLENCARTHGIEVDAGDIVLVRTGHLARRRREKGWGDFSDGPAPGLGLSACDFLCPRGVAAVAADTWGLEVQPSQCAELSHPVHVVLLVNAGVLIGEIWDLEALAEDCAADGVYEFLLSAAPLTITGAVASPINPVAVK